MQTPYKPVKVELDVGGEKDHTSAEYSGDGCNVVLRRSSRSTAGKHSNPYNLPKSVLHRGCNSLQIDVGAEVFV